MIELNNKYKSLFINDDRYYIITGGRSSGKSFAVAYWCVITLLFEPGHIILFTRYTMKSAHISIIPEITSKIELIGKLHLFEITKDSITCTATGSKILFRGIRTSSGDQTANLKSLQGVTTWILDESEELMDESIFDKINLSVRAKSRQNKVILLLNPTTKAHWIYSRFFEKNGVEPGSNVSKGGVSYIHTSYLENYDTVDKSFLQEIEWIKNNNPDKYNHIILGGWLDAKEGVIFTNWTIGNFDDSLPYLFGEDFGFSTDPTTLVKVAINKKLRKIYLKEELYQPGLTTTEIWDNIKWINKSLVIADSAEPRLIEELRRKGLNIKATKKGAGSVNEGITLMQDYELIIEPNSVNIIKELNNYVWSDKKGGVPVDMYNHAIDAARYAITHQLKNSGTGGLYIK